MSTVDKNCLSMLNDDEWLEYIMNQYDGELFRIALLYLKDWNLAEDAIQEVYIKCYLKRSSFRGDSSLKTWIFSILTNTCMDIFRSPSYKRVVPCPKSLYKLLFPPIPSAESTAVANEEQLFIHETIQSLPVKYSEVIILFYYKGLSIKQISSVLEINESTIKVRLKRAREKIKNKVLECLCTDISALEA